MLYHCQGKLVWFFFLKIHIPFISFSCLIVLPKSSSTTWNRYLESGNLVFYLSWVELFWVFLHLLRCWLWAYCILPSLCLCFYFVSPIWMTFIMKRCWILLSGFSISNEMIMCFLLSVWLCCLITLDFHILNSSCISRMNPIWS